MGKKNRQNNKKPAQAAAQADEVPVPVDSKTDAKQA